MNARILLVLILFAGAAFAANSYVIAVDASGSMAYKVDGVRKFITVQDALVCMLGSMKPGDEMAIFVFEDLGKVTLVQNFTTDKGGLESAIRGMTSTYGGSDLPSGINVSSTFALANARNPNKFIIVISDGGSATAALFDTAAHFHRAGITKMQVVGIGVDTNVRPGMALEGIADNGGGSFYTTDDYSTTCATLKAAYEDTAVRGGGIDWWPLGILVLIAIALAYVAWRYLARPRTGWE